MTQFPTAGHLTSWARLAPGIKESAGKNKGKDSTGHGNAYLAAILGNAAAGVAKTSTFLGERHRRIARRRGSKRAIVAIADLGTVHQLLGEIDDIVSHRPALGTLINEIKDFRDVLTSRADPRATGALPLSPAELRLLPYLQTHLTADQIAERLFVSSHTIRTQAKSIYRKLGVSSRNDAVQQATAFGLLGG